MEVEFLWLNYYLKFKFLCSIKIKLILLFNTFIKFQSTANSHAKLHERKWSFNVSFKVSESCYFLGKRLTQVSDDLTPI